MMRLKFSRRSHVVYECHKVVVYGVTTKRRNVRIPKVTLLVFLVRCGTLTSNQSKGNECVIEFLIYFQLTPRMFSSLFHLWDPIFQYCTPNISVKRDVLTHLIMAKLNCVVMYLSTQDIPLFPESG